MGCYRYGKRTAMRVLPLALAAFACICGAGAEDMVLVGGAGGGGGGGENGRGGVAGGSHYGNSILDSMEMSGGAGEYDAETGCVGGDGGNGWLVDGMPPGSMPPANGMYAESAHGENGGSLNVSGSGFFDRMEILAGSGGNGGFAVTPETGGNGGNGGSVAYTASGDIETQAFDLQSGHQGWGGMGSAGGGTGGTGGDAAFVSEHSLGLAGIGQVYADVGCGRVTFIVNELNAASDAASMHFQGGSSGSYGDATVHMETVKAVGANLKLLFGTMHLSDTTTATMHTLMVGDGTAGRTLTIEGTQGENFTWTGGLAIASGGNTLNAVLDAAAAGNSLHFDLGGMTGAPMLTVNGGLVIDADTAFTFSGASGSDLGSTVTLLTGDVSGSFTGRAGDSLVISDGYGNTAQAGYGVEWRNGSLELRVGNELRADRWRVGGDTFFSADKEKGNLDLRFGTLVLGESMSGDGKYTVAVEENGAGASFRAETIIVESAGATLKFSDASPLDNAVRSAGGIHIGDIVLRSGSSLMVEGVWQDVSGSGGDAAKFSWSGNLTTYDNVRLGGLNLGGKTITAHVTEKFDGTSVLIGNAGGLVMGDGTIVSIYADEAGRQLLENAVGTGYQLTDAVVSGDVSVSLSSGFYDGSAVLDSAGNLFAPPGGRLFRLNGGASRNPLLATGAAANLVVAGGDVVSRAAASFSPMGYIGGDGSAVRAGAFGVTSYSRNRVGVGSYFRSNDFHVVAGPGVRFGTGGAVTDVGVFFEGGWGDYDSYTGEGGRRYSGNGDARTLGGGALVRHETMRGVYAEASVRAGTAKNTYGGLTDDGNTRFTSRTGYFGGTAGVGYIFRPRETDEFDISARGEWNRLGKDTVRTGGGDRVYFDNADSCRGRIAAQYKRSFGAAAVRVMAGWEYEAGGRVKGRVNADAARRIEALKGHTGVMEAGGEFSVAENTMVGIGLHGSLGKRKGWGGHMQIGVGF